MCQKVKSKNINFTIKPSISQLAGVTCNVNGESSRKHFNTFAIFSGVPENGDFCHLTTGQEKEPFLPKASIPTDHGNGAVPAVHGHREVERSDDSNQAYRIPLFNESMARS